MLTLIEFLYTTLSTFLVLFANLSYILKLSIPAGKFSPELSPSHVRREDPSTPPETTRMSNGKPKSVQESRGVQVSSCVMCVLLLSILFVFFFNSTWAYNIIMLKYVTPSSVLNVTLA